MTDDELRHVFEVAEDHALQSGATLSEAAMIAARVVERAARAAAFREAAELCERWADKWRPGAPVLADALRAHSEGER